MSGRDPPPNTAAWWRTKTDAELEDALRGGPVGNKAVDGAIIEINRRANTKHEAWTRRSYWAALTAAVASIAGAVLAGLQLFKG